MNDNEKKVLDALSDVHWDWRTVDGLRRSTGMALGEILEIVLRNRQKIEFEVTPSRDNVIFRLRGRARRATTFFDEALNMLSFGARARSV